MRSKPKLKLMRTFCKRAMASKLEEVVSLQDVLEEDRQLEQDANAVLGDSDDSECTYPKVKNHYIKVYIVCTW